MVGRLFAGNLNTFRISLLILPSSINLLEMYLSYVKLNKLLLTVQALLKFVKWHFCLFICIVCSNFWLSVSFSIVYIC